MEEIHYLVKLTTIREYDVTLQKVENPNRFLENKFIGNIRKIIFFIISMSYIIALSFSFLEKNNAEKMTYSFLLSSFSFWLSFIFGDFMYSKIKKYDADGKTVKNTMLLCFAVFGMILNLVILIFLIRNVSFFLYIKDDLGSILSWLSLIIFSIDKICNK